MPFIFCSAPDRSCYIWSCVCWSPISPLLPLMGLRHPARAAAERWAGKSGGFVKGLAGGENKPPGFYCLKSWAATSALPGTPAPQKRAHHSYGMLLSCPAVWQPGTQSITLLNTLLLSQSSSDTPHACLSNPLTHKLTPAALASLSDVLRTSKVCVYRCISIMLLVEGQINPRLKLIGMWNYLKMQISPSNHLKCHAWCSTKFGREKEWLSQVDKPADGRVLWKSGCEKRMLCIAPGLPRSMLINSHEYSNENVNQVFVVLGH